MLWEEESAIISADGANGNKAILIGPLCQNGTSLNNLTIKPDKRGGKLYLERPSIPVLIQGRQWRFMGFKLQNMMDNIPKLT
jgi:hypothetical protein